MLQHAQAEKALSHPYFRVLQPREAAKMKLICFPGVHGSAAHFRRWPTSFSESVEIWAFSWPKTLPDNYHLFLSELAKEILPHLTTPFAVFGYSLGAIPALGLANLLRETCECEPTVLFQAASVAPSADPALQSQIRELLRQALAESLGIAAFEALYGGEKSLWQAHCKSCETHPPLRCPLTVFGAWEDSMIPYQALEPWKNHTSGAFALQMVAGDHSLLFTQTAFLIESIKHQLLLIEEKS